MSDETKIGGHKMKWYKFLIYFWLPVSIFVGILDGVFLLIGLHWNEGADILQGVSVSLGAVKTVDVVLGVLYICSGCLAWAARHTLARYRTSAINWLVLFFVCDVVLSIVYTLCLYVATGTFVQFVHTWHFVGLLASALVSIIFILINQIYFDKRRDLFVN
ncbi:MAG: hypothetical protein LUD25_04025 [Coriobacteriaceae bacterium]|nr:hypothetical protein [Coriobacteriaceae bacterium]